MAYYLLPVTRTKINSIASSHVIHNLLDAPGLILVALWIIGFKLVFIPHVDALAEGLGALIVVFIRIGFRVMGPHPLGQFGGCTPGVDLDLVPVGVLEQLGIGEAEFLRARIANEAKLGEKLSLVSVLL